MQLRSQIRKVFISMGLTSSHGPLKDARLSLVRGVRSMRGTCYEEVLQTELAAPKPIC